MAKLGIIAALVIIIALVPLVGTLQIDLTKGNLAPQASVIPTSSPYITPSSTPTADIDNPLQVTFKDKEILPTAQGQTKSIRFTITTASAATVNLFFQLKADSSEAGTRLSECAEYVEIPQSRNLTIMFVGPYDSRFDKLPAIQEDTIYFVDPYFFYDWPIDYSYGITTVSYSWKTVLSGSLSELANGFPRPTETPKPTSNASSTLAPIQNATAGTTPTTELSATQISIEASASSPTESSIINVKGRLSNSNGNPMPNRQVFLSYSFIDGGSWVQIGSGTTNLAGEYNIQWVPTVSGTIVLTVEWIGDASNQPASNQTTLSLLPYQNKQVLTVESNSTVTEFNFNSTNLALSFKVSGPQGTKGYVKVEIVKTLIADVTEVTVFMDDTKLNYTVSSVDNYWIIAFDYHHSIHEVTLYLSKIVDETPSASLSPIPTLTPTESPIQTATITATPTQADYSGGAEDSTPTLIMITILVVAVALAAAAYFYFKRKG